MGEFYGAARFTSPLPEQELLERFGPRLWAAIHAFSTDASYLAEMAENAGQIVYRKQVWEARSEASKASKDPAVVKATALNILAERGVQSPVRRRTKKAA